MNEGIFVLSQKDLEKISWKLLLRKNKPKQNKFQRRTK